MNFIEKHSKLLAAALCFCACGPILSTVHAYETQPGWHGQDADRYYVLESNRQRATGLTEIDNDVYYFNGHGEMQFGWQTISNETYFFGSDGTATTGETTIQGTTYNFQDGGSLIHGWAEDGCYYDEQGFKVVGQWIDDNGARFYFDENGNPVSGWAEIDGNKYYFDADGRMVTGQFEVDGVAYNVEEDGIFRTGWQDRDGVRYYYDENGNRVVNTVAEIDGVNYGFDENGNMLVNTEKDGYTFDESGAGYIVDETVAAPAEDTTVTETPVETPADTYVPETPVETPSEDVSYDQPVQDEYVEAPAETPSEEIVYDQPAVEDTTVNEYVPQEPVLNTSISDIIYGAAMGQLGVNQDCTMLVTNSLAAAGIWFHGWPEEYAALGSWTSNPVPGDIIIYSGHVAVYAGNGQAVHGGWLGNQTVLSSVACTNSLIGYIHVG